VVVIEKATYDTVAEVIEKSLKILKFNTRLNGLVGQEVRKGSNVLVKPNMLSATPPKLAVTTHPAIVEATVKWLKTEKANIVVGDNPGSREKGYGDKAARVTKIAEASLGHYKNLATEAKTVDINLGKTDYAIVSKAFLEADVYISLPKFKTHQLTTLTCSIKNSFGMLVGAEKTRMHSLCRTKDSFSRLIVDIFSIRPPDLIIVDAILGMEGAGPGRTGTPREIGLVIIGTNAVEVDSVIAAHMGLFHADIDHIRIAGELGLGETDLRKIPLIDSNGNDTFIIPLSDFKLPKSAVAKIGTFLGPLLSVRTPIPKVEKDKCSACGICAESCPVEAIEIDGAAALIDNDKCVECFCCQELCPNAAITTYTPLLKLRKNKQALRR
jgi:uncharacterized protein (DUF362 family)/NAD-dependent dihydropyrimidine dehydrogenase PreA subunit